jgi:hypothetical protein
MTDFDPEILPNDKAEEGHYPDGREGLFLFVD